MRIAREAQRALPPGTRRVALVGTRATIDARVYSEPSVEYVWSEDWQRDVDALIVAAKANRDAAVLEGMWACLVSKLEGEGVEAAIVACTDLTRVARSHAGSIALVDASATLAEAVAREYYGGAASTLAR